MLLPHLSGHCVYGQDVLTFSELVAHSEGSDGFCHILLTHPSLKLAGCRQRARHWAVRQDNQGLACVGICLFFFFLFSVEDFLLEGSDFQTRVFVFSVGLASGELCELSFVLSGGHSSGESRGLACTLTLRHNIVYYLSSGRSGKHSSLFPKDISIQGHRT